MMQEDNIIYIKLLMSGQIYFYIIRIDNEAYRYIVICALN